MEQKRREERKRGRDQTGQSPASAPLSASFYDRRCRDDLLRLLHAIARSAESWSESSSSGSASARAESGLGGTANEAAVGAGDVEGLDAAVLVLGDVVLNWLVLSEGSESLGVNGRLVDEDILRTISGGDEAEAFLGVKPLAGALELDR